LFNLCGLSRQEVTASNTTKQLNRQTDRYYRETDRKSVKFKLVQVSLLNVQTLNIFVIQSHNAHNASVFVFGDELSTESGTGSPIFSAPY